VPSFLKINPHATLPTLTADGKAYTSTIDVVRYLIQNAPVAPGKPSGTDLVKRIHDDDIDPNFALLLARNDEELTTRGNNIGIAFLGNRQAMLEKHSKTPEAAEYSEFYKDKIVGNGGLLAIYKGEVPEDVKENFFKTSEKHWGNLTKFIVEELPPNLPESGFIGGDKPAEDDFHVGGWLARIIATIGGKDAGALSGENALNQPVPLKVVKYFETWAARDSWQTVYADGLH